MHAHVRKPFGSVVPTLRYRDVAQAADWLCKAFGFEPHLVVPGDNGAVRYAELTFGGGMVMLAPVEDSAFQGLMLQPQEAGGAETQICYLFVEDAAAHCARAKAAGAEIVLDIEKPDGSGRGYSCRDPEGHIWNFGTYNPWKRQAAAPDRGERRRGAGATGLGRAALVSCLLLAAAASAVVVAWGMGNSERNHNEPAVAQPGYDQVDPVETAQRLLREAREQLARERSAKEVAERGARTAREQLSQAREAAERAAKEMQSLLVQERTARETAERTSKETREQLAKASAAQSAEEARVARERATLEAANRAALEVREQLSLAERATETVREELAVERAARAAAERAKLEALEELALAVKAREAGEREEREEKAREAKEAKDRAAREAAEQAARERQQRNARRPAPRQAAEPSPSITPYTIWPK